MRRCQFLILILPIFLLTFTLFCCHTSPQPKVLDIPPWLNTIPVDSQYFYAVGMSGQTLKVKDAWDQAIQRARAELGKTIITHVSSHDLVITTTRGEYVKQLIEVLSDTELNFTEVIKRWLDRAGSYGPPNHYYVLVRLEKKRAEMILKSLK
jgi:hypothetical protein